MTGFLSQKKESKTSKQVFMKDLQGVETKYLVNGVDNLEAIPLNRVYDFMTEGEWRGIPILVSLREVVEGEEYDLLMAMYGPKKVPKLGEIFPMMVEFVNTTPDPSNIGGLPRTVTVEQFKEAVTVFLQDDDIDSDGVNRLSKLVSCPASTKYHDNQNGGLLRHIAKSEELFIKSFANQQFSEYEVHPLLMVTAILFHDMGKIDQFVYNPELQSWDYAEYSNYRGHHIGMGLERWARRGRRVCDILGLSRAEFWDIWHLIGSHHGPVNNGFGSLMDPFGHDAWTLYTIDLMESRQEEEKKPVRTE